jgi:hypothetical protein
MAAKDVMITITLTMTQWEIVVGTLEDKSARIGKKISTGIKYDEVIRLNRLIKDIDHIATDISDEIDECTTYL